MKKQGRPPKLNRGRIIAAYYEQGSVEAASKELNVTTKTFYNSMERLGLEFVTRLVEK